MRYFDRLKSVSQRHKVSLDSLNMNLLFCVEDYCFVLFFSVLHILPPAQNISSDVVIELLETFMEIKCRSVRKEPTIQHENANDNLQRTHQKK